jgi:hypothetical protein
MDDDREQLIAWRIRWQSRDELFLRPNIGGRRPPSFSHCSKSAEKRIAEARQLLAPEPPNMTEFISKPGFCIHVRMPVRDNVKVM